MFYESKHSLSPDLCKIRAGKNVSFPPHLHSSFEFITVTEGEMTVTVDNRPYDMTAGSALLIFPHQIHALKTPHTSRHILCIFSPHLVQAYSGVFLHSFPESNLFHLPAFCREALEIAAEEPTDILHIKGLLYSLCGAFDRTARYHQKPADREGLLTGIFRFIEVHFGDDCSLRALAMHTAYHYVYLSRYFKRCTGFSFTDYVNRYRVDEASYMLKNSDKSVLQIALDCGFESLRSFNRNFKAITGKTPSAYRVYGAQAAFSDTFTKQS